MDPALRAHVDTHLHELETLVGRGRLIADALVVDPADQGALAASRVWQQDCAAAVNQLSGGTKAHWLARAYSDAFLDRSKIGPDAESAAPAEIAARVIAVLKQGVASLSRMGDTEAHNAVVGGSLLTAEAPAKAVSFGFVNTPRLRPIVEQAYAEGRRALEQGDYRQALLTTCGIIEAIVTDALEHKGLPPEEISRWSFAERLTAAQASGLIRGGAARLPAFAREYRDVATADVTERDAKVTQQVLHVLMRDLDPGR